MLIKSHTISTFLASRLVIDVPILTILSSLLFVVYSTCYYTRDASDHPTTIYAKGDDLLVETGGLSDYAASSDRPRVSHGQGRRLCTRFGMVVV